MEEDAHKEVAGSEMLRSLIGMFRTHESSCGADRPNRFFSKGCNGPDECTGAVESARRRKTAAVLVCLFEGIDGELRVILTKRSMKLSSYPGDVALPGGKMDESDADEIVTALREATEEIGLDSSLVRVVSILEPFKCQKLTDVIPVVGLVQKMEEFNPSLNVDEVDAIFDVPLDMFLKDENHGYEERTWMGWKYATHCFDYRAVEDGVFHIRGLTARILIEVASIVYGRGPSFDSPVLDFQRLQQSLTEVE